MLFRGEWDHASGAKAPYGTVFSYRKAAEFLDGICPVVEDWGCGYAAAKPYFKRSRYVGVDGSASPYADKVADLLEYRSQADGILIRHVLEHNYDWPLILRNAVESFRRRMCLVFFLPLAPYTSMYAVNPSGVPNLHVGRIPLMGILAGLEVREETVPRNDSSPHKAEFMVYVERLPKEVP